MPSRNWFGVAILAALPCSAQLTLDQKIADFQYMAGLYAKRYGPYEWKRDAIKFDLFNIAPWLDKIRAGKDDLDFYETMSEYVSSLNDAHDVYSLPSNFSARLNFGVDIYDGKLLVDTISRTRLPASEFPFLIGYELVSIDGQDAQKLLDGLLRYEIAANPRSTRRLAAQLLTIRPQSLMPHAASIPEISTVIFRRPDGGLESYRIPWTKSGLLLTSVGKYTTPAPGPSGSITGASADVSADPSPDDPPAIPSVLERLQNIRIPDRGVNGFGAQTPIFLGGLPSNFVLRLGRTPGDVFFSGTFEANGLKIGFIRIPNYAPANQTAAINAFASEIAFFQANTDGLIVDEMRNPGGSVSYCNTLISLLMPTRWRAIPFEVRATSEWVIEISSAYESAKAQGAPDSFLQLLQNLKNAIVKANAQARGRTDPIPLDDVVIDRDPARDNRGNVIAYTKPLIVLIDEMSASGGDYFPATIQDNGRGPLVGWRTMGAGGNVEDWEAGSYSLGITRVTESLMVRKTPIATPEYPTAPYVENIGVRPDIPIDYMTTPNLLLSGKPFFDAAIDAVTAEIRKGKTDPASQN